MKEKPKFYFAPVGAASEAHKPNQAKSQDTGYDVSVSSEAAIVIAPHTFTLIPLGVKVISPEGWWLQLNPRSSTFFKKHLISLVGVIDNGYENQIQLAVMNPNDKAVVVEPAERVGQLIPMRLEKMDIEWVDEDEFLKLSLEKGSDRGQGGFGSTGHH